MPAGSMVLDAVADSSPPTFTDPTFTENDIFVGYNKLISIRDNVIAKKASFFKQSNQTAILANGQSSTSLHQSSLPSTQAPNGALKSTQVNNAATAQSSSLHVPKTNSTPFQPKSPNIQKLPTSTSGSSGIDPIFLTKSDVLVRAETHQKRQRLERALEEQVHRSQRQKAPDQEALPDFDITEILRRAQELVKPVAILENRRADVAASSSDSFDENTFYSSQMDESTTTEEADESHKMRQDKICNFFRRGETCRYGDTCQFSHDPALKQKLEADRPKTMHLGRVNADEQTSSRQNEASNKRARRNVSQPKLPVKEATTDAPIAVSQGDRERQERIARLETELRNAKAERERHPDSTPRHHAKETNDSQEDSAYSPPGPDEFGRDVGLRELPRQPGPISQRRPSPIMQPQMREYGRRTGDPPSPLPNNVRIITSHIRSPVAPQPSRVSPLAVAKVPQVSQVQRDHGENRRPSRMSNAGNMSAGRSPNVASQPRSSKKRRRGPDVGEQMRNVVPRTDLNSPVVRVKEEPISPPPFNIAETELRQVRLRQADPRQTYVDAAAPRYRDQEEVFYQPRALDHPAYGSMNDERGPQTPLVRRVVSRNGQQYISNEDQDLRRIATAPRQVRAPMSPASYPVQYSAPQPRTTRATSPVYMSPTGQGVPHQYRDPVQTQPITYVPHDQSPSPTLHRMPQSPAGRPSIAMAPPPRRIVVDQWGNRFLEAPMPVERHISVAPAPRANAFDPRYEQMVPRGASVMRQPQVVRVDDESQYVRRAASPSSNGYFEIPSRQMVDPRSDLYEEEPYATRSNGPRVAEYPDTRPVARYEEIPARDARIVRMQSVRPTERQYDEAPGSDERISRMQSVRPPAVERQYQEAPGPGERIVRMQSVRPVERQYEAPRERITRVQSVRPEQPRIIRLGETQEPGRHAGRQVSMIPDTGDLRPVSYAVQEQSRYQYAPQSQSRGYIEELQDDGGLYEAPGSGGRRVMQRM